MCTCTTVFGQELDIPITLPVVHLLPPPPLSEFQGLNLSDSGDGDTLGPLPPGGIWGSDGEYSTPPYEYFQNRSSNHTTTTGSSQHTTGSSKSPSPGTPCTIHVWAALCCSVLWVFRLDHSLLRLCRAKILGLNFISIF